MLLNFQSVLTHWGVPQWLKYHFNSTSSSLNSRHSIFFLLMGKQFRSGSWFTNFTRISFQFVIVFNLRSINIFICIQFWFISHVHFIACPSWMHFCMFCEKFYQSKGKQEQEKGNTNDFIRPLVLSLMTIINYNWNIDIFIKLIRMNVSPPEE